MLLETRFSVSAFLSSTSAQHYHSVRFCMGHREGVRDFVISYFALCCFRLSPHVDWWPSVVLTIMMIGAYWDNQAPCIERL